MSYIEFDNIGISALAAALPKNIVKNSEENVYFSENEIKSLIKRTGVVERRVTDAKTCSSDLCFAASEQLLKENDIDRDDIDFLIFVSQTPDYRMPATAFLLQERLKLKKETLVFDVNLACTGFINGLVIAFSILQNSGFRKGLLLNGETRSKVYSKKDRKGTFLFGDAGTAALIEKQERFEKSFFSFNADGSDAKLTIIPAGGYRIPSSTETLEEKIVDEEGNIANDEHVKMNGYGIFSLFVKEIPKDINNMLEYSGNDVNTIDYFVFHQANAMMNEFVAKKLKIDKSKIPSTLHKYGNTSSTSIPLAIVSELKQKASKNNRLLLNALGAGMSWASAVIQLNDCKINEIVEI
jgi:3-oxoacyl-[acyl-carrier-protein] synthase-3